MTPLLLTEPKLEEGSVRFGRKGMMEAAIKKAGLGANRDQPWVID